MSSPSDPISIWNKLAALYRDKFSGLTLYKESYDYLYSRLPEGATSILDLGCGPGIISRYLLSRNPELRILGIDTAPAMVALSAEAMPGATFRVMDVRDAGKLGEIFDAVVCGFCLPYLSYAEADKLLGDCGALLRPNGLLYLSFVEGEEQRSGYRTGSTGDQLWFNYYRSEKMIEELGRWDFVNCQKFTAEYEVKPGERETHVMLVAEKS